jgi:hypothetical protein
VASVIRLDPGGSSVVVASKLALEEAKEMAARLTEEGDPPRCSWCVWGIGTRKMTERSTPWRAEQQGTGSFSARAPALSCILGDRKMFVLHVGPIEGPALPFPPAPLFYYLKMVHKWFILLMRYAP